MHPPRRSRSRKQASQRIRAERVLATDDDTEFEVVWEMDQGPNGLLRYLLRPRTAHGPGEMLEVDVLPPEAPPSARKRLEEEVQLASRLIHPAIARLHGLYEGEGTAFVLKEHVEGCNLDTVISLGALRGKRMSEAFCLYVVQAVAGALHFAHCLEDAEGRPLGLLHRSVNPGCIRVGFDGQVKLTDFASAYSLLPARLKTPKGLFRGDIEYAAPERLLARGTDRVGVWSDVFSLGMVLLELLTLRSLYGLDEVEKAALQSRRKLQTRAAKRKELPSWASFEQMAALAAAYRPEHVEAAMREVSAPVRAIVHKALCREPTERYATAALLQADLQACPRALRDKPHGAKEAARELRVAREEAEASPRREQAGLLEWGIFAEDVLRRSCS
ncbi:protein kinase domain-containing protein [Archangium sp.]|uniref:serine/threonine protein kinase n=1 Tax=Archangium sp. TaxID=1872627 RepID=UPI00286C65FF|nr:protein kinase [Archangium sp.]